ncbi:CDP-alcohol phosphatidyltransferase family protein [Sphingomonas morindae]|uniref:Phosphatidylcholine/phosphatidylserine synthase n=1 Tax=Sphingomonas morindae TaxID=1541170 RepID=A0ABY4X6H6_9SPHN|nr:phosphatidylcholine/phosphatidylserine synthase [Sphingomonas morindae]USI72496.1 phosphatidylcholine/phosphatidylserine synthase [Sphingomonas morindae]
MAQFRSRLRPPPAARRGIPLRAVAPNAVTLMALCAGLSAVRFAIGDKWELAVGAIIAAGVLDGLDGRVARLLHGESRFGAELDSLSDVIAFGVSPAVMIYLWSLQYLPQFGWTIALSHAACCALRLARFNAQIDAAEQPRKKAGFFTGIPAPAGAGTAMAPIFLWLATGEDLFRSPYLVAPWTAMTALLMVSNLPTFSWASLRLRRGMRFGALVGCALFFAALINLPWPTLSAVAIAYLASIPFAWRSYARVRQRVARLGSETPPPAAPL